MADKYGKVRGRFLEPVGVEDKPLRGTLTFTPRATAVGEDTVYLPSSVVVPLSKDGVAEVDLLAPHDGVKPESWSWHVDFDLAGTSGPVQYRHFDFDLKAGQTVNLAAVLPLPDPECGQYVTRGVPGAKGDKGDPGEDGRPGEKGEDGVSISDISSAGDALIIHTSDGATHRLPIPVGLIGQGSAGSVTDHGDGTGTAQGNLLWEDNEDGTAQVGIDTGGQLTFIATATTLEPGAAPTVEVSGVFPSFKLHFGLPAPAKTPTSGLLGTGRPDLPETLSVENQEAVATAPVGTTFTSTDGAGTGAWAWIKTPTGWQVTYCDTGRIRAAGVYSPELLTDSRSLLTIRRIGNTVTVGAQLIGPKLNTRMHIEMPPGFQPPSGGMHAALTFQVAQQPAFPAPWGNGRFRPMMSATQEFWGALDTATNKQMYVGGTFHTSEPWPTTLPSKPTF